MGNIKALDKRVYEKIAAGEVIDRPAAVVRELLDNAFDAHAEKIKIQFENGGLDEITVADDGEGIYFEDLDKAPIKHCTSKIAQFEDIFSIYTMGFRGEALSSIASVSRMRITSFNGLETHGGELVVEGGETFPVKPFVRKKGTTVEVKDLFYNIPARQKFVKSAMGESRAIKDVIITKTLPYQNTAVEVINSGKTILETKSKTLMERLEEYFTPTVDVKYLMEITQPETEHGIKIYGYAGSPQLYYHNRSYQYFYVNNRPITMPAFYYAVSSVYEGLIPGGKYPVVFLFMEINPALLDVNIHPAKKEIKIINDKHIFSLIRKSMSSAFQAGFVVPDFMNSEKTKDGLTGAAGNHFINEIPLPAGIFKQGAFPFSENLELPPSSFPDEKTIEAGLEENNNRYSSRYKIIGILFHTYLLAEYDNEFFMVDYHAAHERINYEKLVQSVKNKGIHTQKLLSPFQVELSSEEADFLHENLSLFRSLGYEIDEFGDNAFVVNGVPAYKKYGDDLNFFLDTLHSSMKIGEKPEINTLLDETLKMEACRMSIKSGDDPLSSQISNLIEELMISGYALSCPHGRPILFKMTKEEIDKKFLRKI